MQVRGPRAPETALRAQAKRLYVASTPYLVGSASAKLQPRLPVPEVSQAPVCRLHPLPCGICISKAAALPACARGKPSTCVWPPLLCGVCMSKAAALPACARGKPSACMSPPPLTLWDLHQQGCSLACLCQRWGQVRSRTEGPEFEDCRGGSPQQQQQQQQQGQGQRWQHASQHPRLTCLADRYAAMVRNCQDAVERSVHVAACLFAPYLCNHIANPIDDGCKTEGKTPCKVVCEANESLRQRSLNVLEGTTLVTTTAERVTSGKSAIHGWGAFAKTHHRAGEMVIEYAGGRAGFGACCVRKTGGNQQVECICQDTTELGRAGEMVIEYAGGCSNSAIDMWMVLLMSGNF
eukprot:1159740-Pelagomonas_calceolata.AAC.2